MKAAFCTLGCKVNQYDTEAMRELFENAGYETVDFSEPADVYVVNTCTVTQTGDKKRKTRAEPSLRIGARAPIDKILRALIKTRILKPPRVARKKANRRGAKSGFRCTR